MATIKVRGHGSAPTRAEEAVLSFEVASIAESAADAFAETTRKAAALASMLDDAGIDVARRSTTGVAVHDVHELDGQQPARRRHRAATAINVRLADPQAIERLLREAIDRSDAGVHGPVWHVADADDVQSEACRAAADDATRRATAYAGQLGLRVGAVIAVDEGASAVPLAPRTLAATALPIYPAELAVSAVVDVTFELVP